MGDLREAKTDRIFTMDEVRQHNKEDDAWLVVDEVVYDISNFWKKHPGGQNVIFNYAGMDATQMYHLFHFRKHKADKFLQFYEKGKVKPDSICERNRGIDKDFEELTAKLKDMGLFKPSYWVEPLIMLHVPVLFWLSMTLVTHLGDSWPVVFLSALIFSWGLVQASYVVHDFGHRAVTNNVTIDYFFQHIFTNIAVGFCAEFLQIYHNLHHTFPHKTGAVLDHAVKSAGGTRKKLPFYKVIANYLTSPPVLFPYLWGIASLKLCIQNRQWLNVFTYMLFYVWSFGFFVPHIGWTKTLVHWMITRQLWSHIIFFAALSTHPTAPENHEGMTFFEYQIGSTSNFTTSPLQDYLTGGQADQIEHHLWPHMPRENFRKAVPYVEAMCKKWNIYYSRKPVVKALTDVLSKMRQNPGASRPYDVWCQMMYRTK